MKKYIAIIALFLIFVSSGLLLIMQNSKHSNDNNSGISEIEYVVKGSPQPSQTDISIPNISGAESTDQLTPEVMVTDAEKEIILSECIELSELYQEIYQTAEKTPSQYWGADDEIAQETIDEIENILALAGYPVINSDSFYPDYLENSDGVYSFWESVNQEIDAEAEIWSVLASGGLSYRRLQFLNKIPYCIHATASWNENGEMELSYIEKRKVLHWDMTYNQDFYYQDIYTDRHWTASVLLRLHPVDEALYDLNAKYIMPIGYHNVNLFLLDWDSSNYGHLCFNDMLDSFYRMENNDYFYARDYLYYATPYSHSAIPAQLFEKTILPYFDISLDQFREMSLYDAYTDTYPWQDLCCDNILYYPSLIPEVIDCIEVDESTIKLIVNVMCLDNKTDKLFVHEVTIRLLDDGKYQYIGNQITYKGDIAIPSAQTRIPEQRFDEGQADRTN